MLSSNPTRLDAAALDELDADIRALSQNRDIAEILRLGSAAAFVDRLPGCRRALRRVARLAAGAGAAVSVIYADIELAMEAHATGQWAEAWDRGQEAARLADERGQRLLCLEARAVLAAVAADRGDAGPARAYIDEATAWAVPRGAGFLLGSARHAEVRLAVATGDFEAAYRAATRISPAGLLAPYETYALFVHLDLIEAALHTDRPDQAAAHSAAVHASGLARISPRQRMLVTAGRALVADDDEAVSLFEAALEVEGTSPWPFDVARVQLLFGERLRRMREAARARVHLETAIEVFERLGAAPWSARAAGELRATGQVRVRRSFGTNEALTPQELEIALLAAAGLSNKQIGTRLLLSHRTVGAHLYRVFPKLGINSRAALRDALAAR
ncbi:LuxR C-terminal-related transcriptional regulator [Catenulispora yoronensis]